MKKLTKAEEQVMQLVWELDRCTVSNILEKIGEPKPPHSTISSIVRILEKKGFLDHKAYGRTHEYFALVPKEDYTKLSVKSLVSQYFDGSTNELVSFLVREKDLDLNELGELINQLKKEN